MGDNFHEDEKIITGYDPEIIKRLLSYLRPHWVIMLIGVIALIIASAAELGMPVIVQRAIDQDIITKYVRVSAEETDRPSFGQIDFSEKTRVGDYYYLLESDLTFLSGADRGALREQDVLGDELYYVFPQNERTEPIIEAHPELFITGDEAAAIERDALSRLSLEERRTIRHMDIESIKGKVLFFLILLFAILVFMFLQVVLMAYTGQNVMKDLRMQLYSHIIHQSLRFLNTRPVGKLVTRLTNDVETVNELFAQVLGRLIRNIVMMVGVVVTLFIIDPTLAAVTMATLPPVVLATVVFRRRARDAFRRVRRWVSRVNGFLSEHISGMAVVQMFVQEQRTDREFEERNREMMKASLGEMYVFAIFRPIIDLLSSISIAVIIFFGAFFLLRGVVSLGILVAFVDLIRRFYRQLMEISERFVVIQSALAGSERVFSLLDEEERIEDTGEQHLGEPIRGEVVFDHVWFSYKPGEPVIRDLSFRVQPGETVAIVGYTGAGKTTIANLLTRLWDYDSGQITIDGLDIREIPLDELRRNVQPIHQDVFLFHDTIEENIRLGADISGETIRKAAWTVQADHFIENLEEGYQTELQEGASNISTGQRQLISFARIIAHDPRIIILDEATSSVDTETEQLIQHALGVVLEGRTSLVIAHRLSTIKYADRILVLSNGKLVEQGNHDELLKMRGLYYNLYTLQYSGM